MYWSVPNIEILTVTKAALNISNPTLFQAHGAILDRNLLLCLCRSKIRIRDGRAKPIDLLAKYISAEDDDLSVEMHEPYTFLNGLTVTDMDDLLEDIKVCATKCYTL